MAPLHHAAIKLSRGIIGQEYYELLLTRSSDTVVHRVIQAGLDWCHLRFIAEAKDNAFTVEDEESGLVPFMLVAEKYIDDDHDVGASFGSLTMLYELLCLSPGALKKYDVSSIV